MGQMIKSFSPNPIQTFVKVGKQRFYLEKALFKTFVIRVTLASNNSVSVS